MESKKEVMHTPTPWNIGSFGAIEGHKEGNGIPVDYIAKVQPLNGCCNYMESEKAKANAAFIVKSVNAHDALVEAVNLLLALNDGSTANDRFIIRGKGYDALRLAQGKGL